MQGLDTLAPIVCMPCCKLDIITHIYDCTLNNSCVMNVNMLNPPVLATGKSLIKTLTVFNGRKLQLISLAPGQHQPHMVIWHSLLLKSLKPLPILLRLQRPLKNLATILLHILSITSSLDNLGQWTMQVICDNEGEFTGLLPNSSYCCWPSSWFRQQIKICSPMQFSKRMHQTVANVLKTLLLAKHHRHAVRSS